MTQENKNTYKNYLTKNKNKHYLNDYDKCSCSYLKGVSFTLLRSTPKYKQGYMYIVSTSISVVFVSVIFVLYHLRILVH